MLMEAGEEINAQGGLYGNTLQAALIRDYEKVVQMLLDARAKEGEWSDRNNDVSVQ